MSLVPASEKDFSALYDVRTKTLHVTAEGSFPGVVLSTFFQRDAFLGGVKLSLVGYYGGVNPPTSHELKAYPPFEETISLPARGFNNASVTVETKDATYNIPIHYTGLDPPGNDIAKSVATAPTDGIHTVVLPPIQMYLPGGKQATIKAQISEKGPYRSIDTKFNEKYIRVLNAGISEGDIWWTIQWAEFPEDEENPQLFEVTTEVYNGVMPPHEQELTMIQGYVVHGVLLKEK